MKSDNNQKKKNPDCPCTWPGCSRHGDCEACKEYHHSNGEKTSCEKQNSGKSK